MATTLAARAAESILRYSMMAPGHRVGIAVSGGADSMALLDVLGALAPDHGWSLAVLHLNHALRGADSDADEAFVRAAAARRGLDCLVERAEGLRPPNLEEKAREARYAFFARAAREHSLDRIATAHTRDDQAETVLLRLLRGAGPTGLAGIAPISPAGIVRPFLEVARADVLDWLGERGLAWREDASNADPVFDRNRLRHQLLPQLAREWNPAMVETLGRTAAVLAAEESYWNEWTASELKPVFDVARLRALHPAALRRLLRAAIARAKGDLRQIDLAHVDRLAALIAGPRGSGSIALPGAIAIRSFDRLLIARTPRPAPAAFRIAIDGPGRVELPGGTLRVRYNTMAGETPQRAVVRPWQPGDAYQPIGYRRPRKLKELFQEAKVPSWERPSWPIMEAAGCVIWARRFGMAASAGLALAVEEEEI